MSCYFNKNSLFQVFTIYRSCFIDSISNLWTGPPIILGAVFNNNTKGPLLGVNVIIKQRFQVTVTDFECKGWFAGVASCFYKRKLC